MCKTLLEQMALHYRERGQSPFTYFLSEGRSETISYGELLRRAAVYARRYRQAGASPGASVIIVLKHEPDLLYAFVGALLARAVPSFLPFPSAKQDPDSYWRDQQKLLSRLGTRVLVTYEDNLPAIHQHVDTSTLALLTPREVDCVVSALEPTFEVVDPDAVAFLQHTSGTTGLKKGIALSHRAVLNQIRAYARVLGITSADRIASWLPLYHDMGLIACFLQPLVLGVPVVAMGAFEWLYDPVTLLQAIDKYQATFVWLPNFSFQHMALTIDAKPVANLSGVKAFINCSEPCKSATFDIFLDKFASWGVRRGQLQSCYAMAETVFAVTQTTLDEPVVERRSMAARQTSSRSLSVGKPIPGLEVRIVDDQRGAVPEGTIGEVAVAGHCLFSGYFKQPEDTALVMDQGWYYTGDLGFLAEGELHITGRKKDLLIVNGRNLYAHDLEFAANQVEGVKKGRVAAIGVYDESVGSEQIVVIAETPAARPEERQAIARAMKKTLMRELDVYINEAYLVPAGWIVKTTSGKISREANRSKYLAAKAAVTTAAA